MHNQSHLALLLAVSIFGILSLAHASDAMEVRSGTSVEVHVALDANPRPVTWSASIADAQRIASEKQRPFIIYFCPADLAAVAGGDEQAFADYRKSHSGDSPDWTVFDSPRMTAEMNKIRIAAYVKIPDTAGNAKLLARYGAKPGSAGGVLFFCTPEGDAFAHSGASQEDVLDAIFSLHERYVAWRDQDTTVALANDSRFR